MDREALGPFEVKTLRINPRTRRMAETNMMEEPVRKQ